MKVQVIFFLCVITAVLGVYVKVNETVEAQSNPKGGGHFPIM